MLQSLIKAYQYMARLSTQSHKSNEMKPQFEIESHSQSIPPSPNRLQSSIASPLSMYQDTDLKFLQLQVGDPSGTAIYNIISGGIKYDDRDTWSGADSGKLYLTSGVFSSTVYTSRPVHSFDEEGWG